MNTLSEEERKELETIYRQHIGAIRSLARLLGYPCPIAERDKRPRATLDMSATLKSQSTNN